MTILYYAETLQGMHVALQGHLTIIKAKIQNLWQIFCPLDGV